MHHHPCPTPGSRRAKPFLVVAALILCTRIAGAQTTNYFGTSGALNGNVWSTSPSGPYTSAFDATGGGIIQFNNAATFTGASLTVAGINATASATDATIGGTIANFNNGVIAINTDAGATLDFSTQSFTSSGTAGYVKNGAGVLALSGNTYGGGFTLNAGTLIARGVNAMGGNVASDALTINGGAIGANANRDFSGKYSSITLGGDFQLGVSASAVSIASDTANLIFNTALSLGGTTRAITIGANGTYTLGGVISGSADTALTIDKLASATGTLSLTNANLFTGKTVVNGGTLSIASDASLGVAPASVVADQFTLNGGTLASSANVTFAANRGITLGANGGTIKGASGSALQTFNNVISGPGALTLSLGAADFKVANTFSGGLNLAPTTGAVVARFDADNSAGTGVISVSPSTTGGNVTLRNVGGISTSLANDVVLNQNNGKTIAIVSDAGGTFTLSGRLSGVGTVTRGLQGVGGEVVLSGDNSGWSGGLVAQRGMTTLGNKNALGSGTLTISPDTAAGFDAVALSASTALTGANAVATPISIAIPTAAAIPSLTIGGTHDLELSGAITLSVSSPTINNNNAGATIISGTIGDGGAGLGMTLQGSGNLTLSGNNTYSGPTVINAGTVNVKNTAGSATGSGNVTVNSGATLKGSGVISGALVLNAGATLAPGNGPGRLTTGSQSWEGGATYQFELNDATGTAGSNSDLVTIAGDLTLDATPANKFKVDVTSLTPGGAAGDIANFDKTQNYSWKLAEVSGVVNGFDSGAFDILGANFSNDTTGAGATWSVTQAVDGAGKDLYLNYTAVPEPSTLALAVFGLAGLWMARERQKRW